MLTRAALLLLAALLVACDNADEPRPVATPTPAAAATLPPATATATPAPPTATATATPEPPLEVVYYPPGTLTGVPAIDAVIAAAANVDAKALAAQVVVAPVACTTAQGLGGPPKCPQGAADGTLLTRFGVVGCEGGWSEAEHLSTAAEGWFAPGIPPIGSEPLSLYAILIIDDRYQGMPGDYYVVFGFPDGQGRALSVAEAGTTHLWFGCLPSPVEQWTQPFVSIESRFLLPPLGR